MARPSCATCGQPHPKCVAHNRRHAPCGKPPVSGAAVCRNHGGAAPQVIARAKQRLLEALDPAAAEVVRIALGQAKTPMVTKDGDVVMVPPSPAVRLRAAETIMDRVGLPARQDLELNVSTAGEARRLLSKTFPMDKEDQ